MDYKKLNKAAIWVGLISGILTILLWGYNVFEKFRAKHQEKIKSNEAITDKT